ncbi:MAG: O-antigen ligase family protein [Chloroherpetonaceae bacterium]|nr:O-antigen ligase family protein [Chloroherpetonaceae bacterium]MDW8438220.1 O-antigen ligase family protein [Chloroherpetonaceae bacterium]
MSVTSAEQSAKLPVGKLSVVYAALALLVGATYALHPLLPLGLGLTIGVFAFRRFVAFSALFFAIVAFFFLVSPNVPPHEKHFRSPILFNGFLAQDALLFVALFLFAINVASENVAFPKPKTLVEKAFLLFAISFGCSLVVGVARGNRMEFFLTETRDFCYLLLFWLIIAYAARFERACEWFLVFVGFCAAFAVISVIDCAIRYKFARYNSGISFLLLGGFFFALSAFLVREFEKNRALFAGLLIAFGFAILIAYTRGLFLGLLVGLIVVMMRIGGRQAIRLTIVFALIAAVVLGTALLFGLTIDFMVEQTTKRGMEVSGGIDVSSAERVLEVVAVLNEMPNHPIFGAGVGATIRVYRFTELVGRVGMTDWWFIHNNYAQTLHKQGLFGLVALLFLWLSACWKSFSLFARASEPKKKVLLLTSLGTLAGMMTISMTNSVMTYSNTNFLNALLFAIVALIEREERERQTLAPER